MDPSVEVLKTANNVHYSVKNTARRRRVPKVNTSALSIPIGANILPVIQTARKQDHTLLAFLNSGNTWKLSPSNVVGRTKQTPRSTKQKQSTKAKTKNFAQNFPRNPSIECTPGQFLRKTETLPVNNKPSARARLLKFQATHDKTKIWKIEILPNDSSGKRYSAIISPANEQPSSCIIGGKHATDLYIRRLKDMFTSNGKTRCILDQEVDYTQYLNYSQAQAQAAQGGQARISTTAPATNPGQLPGNPAVTGAPIAPHVPQPTVVQGNGTTTPTTLPNKLGPRPVGAGVPQPLTTGNTRIMVVKQPVNNINNPRLRQPGTTAQPGTTPAPAPTTVPGTTTRRPPSTNPTGQPTVTTPGTTSFINPPQQFNGAQLKQLTQFNIGVPQRGPNTTGAPAQPGQTQGQPIMQNFGSYPTGIQMFYNMGVPTANNAIRPVQGVGVPTGNMMQYNYVTPRPQLPGQTQPGAPQPQGQKK